MTTPRWKTSMQKASFRGVEFGVVDSEMAFGRRNVSHEYPLRDDPYAEDLGKKAREFTINAFVIGDDYIQARDALISAIEDQNTPGILIHPTLGIRNVVPTPQCKVIFKNTDGGIEYFSLTFIDAGSNKYPTAVQNTQKNSDSVADSSIAVIQDSFSSMFNVNGFPDNVATRAVSTLVGNSSALSGNTIPVSASFAGILLSLIAQGAISSDLQSNFSTYQSSLNDFNSTASSLVTTPVSLASAVTNLINGLNKIYSDNPGKALAALIQLYNQFGTGLSAIPLVTATVTSVTPTRAQEALNQQQIIDLVGLAALIEMVRAVSLMTFTSRQDALQTSAKIDALIQVELIYLANNGYDDTFNTLTAARVAMISDITARAGTLKDIVYVQTNASIPALVFAYNQYGDASQETDIVSRNNIRNPGFVPPLTGIEILQ